MRHSWGDSGCDWQVASNDQFRPCLSPKQPPSLHVRSLTQKTTVKLPARHSFHHPSRKSLRGLDHLFTVGHGIFALCATDISGLLLSPTNLVRHVYSSAKASHAGLQGLYCTRLPSHNTADRHLPANADRPPCWRVRIACTRQCHDLVSTSFCHASGMTRSGDGSLQATLGMP